jgi:hypothetical protein
MSNQPKAASYGITDTVREQLALADLDSSDPLSRIWHYSEAVDALTIALRKEVRAARQSDATWTDLGNVLGTSKQAAQQRYGKPAY